MKTDSIKTLLEDNGFLCLRFEDPKTIDEGLGIKNLHDVVLVVVIDSANLLAYGFNRLETNVSVSHYNQHILRPEFGLTYKLVYVDDFSLKEKILAHAKATTKTLKRLIESNKND